MFIFIPSVKVSTLSTSIIITVLGNLAFSNASQAANLDLDLPNWTSYGDVSLNSNGARITNAYANGLDDSRNFNISGKNPLQAFELESFLSLDDGTLGFEATDTSAISRTFTVQSETTLTFQWTFLTNHTQFESNRHDYAFVAINNLIIPLANTNSPLTSPGLYNFARATGGTFSYTLLPDVDYTIAMGVSDVGDAVTSSALLVQIPEPLTLLGTGTAITFGTWFKRKFKNTNKTN